MTSCDALIVGAGPAGIAAAIRLRQAGRDVVVVDDASAPGGQVWRAAERTPDGIARTLGDEYARGRRKIARFRACGASYRPSTEVWRLDEGWTAFTKHAGILDRISARAVLLATGALERPVPFPGWTLPGVLTVGGAQTLLKSAGQIPQDGVWIAGSGPLVLLYAAQILALRGRVAGWLDTTPRENAWAALCYAPAMMGHLGDVSKGLRWRAKLALRQVPVIRVRDLAAEGQDRLESVRYTKWNGESVRVKATLLLVHEGVVPNVHATMALGCAHRWSAQQHCFSPQLDAFGMTSCDTLYVAGDGGGILGARAATLAGELAALGILAGGGYISAQDAAEQAQPLRRKLRREQRLRRFLDALYRPRQAVLTPADETLVCRCEEVTAGAIRDAARLRGAGPNQVKAFTRAGMGPCQGRQCALTVSQIVASTAGQEMDAVGHLSIRFPLKPVTVGEIARAAELEDI
jgi:NADPH-dependent 2,4-dienoyl-CoA reductase/sulfur reductase-like enzyme